LHAERTIILIIFENNYMIMEFGICILPVVPLRREPNDRSELTTQLLFGETARIFETAQKWLSIETDLDSYPGWVDIQQLTKIPEEEYNRLRKATASITLAPLTPVTLPGGGSSLLPAASLLHELVNGRFTIDGLEYQVNGETKPFKPGSRDGIIQSAISFLNAPYLWGGRTHLGIDCSGLTQAAFRLSGFNIPRDASQQAGVGQNVNLLTEALPGDLAFFDDDQGKIVHVGLIMEAGVIIHASGKVRIDTLDHHGIFRTESRSYSHRLRLIRRILE
jgi:gamma-D-glutamyl-L-lysine dipeptidyl-peptidase